LINKGDKTMNLDKYIGNIQRELQQVIDIETKKQLQAKLRDLLTEKQQLERQQRFGKSSN